MFTSQLHRHPTVNDQISSPTFVLTLLGEPELRFPGGRLAGERWARLFHLLAYLAIEGAVASVRREVIATLLWPDMDPSHRLINLRQRLRTLNKQLGESADDFWHSSDERLMLSNQVWCDAQVLLADDGVADAMQLMKLYRGDLFAGVVPVEAELREWFELQNKRCRHRGAQAAAQATLAALRLDDFSSAKGYLQHWLRIDPDDEVTGRLLMQALSRSGHGTEVQAFYRKWEEVLGRDVARLPEVPTRRLMTQILHSTTEANRPGKELEWRQLALLRIEIALTRRRRQDDATHQSIDDVDEESVALQLGNLLEQTLTTIQQYGGHAVCLPGGTLLAYFGYPVASEHSVIAAWEAMRELRCRVIELEQSKMVLHLARVLSSDLLPDSSGRLTDAVRNIAQRLPPGSCVITEPVRHLLALPIEQRLFAGSDLPEVYLISGFDVELSTPNASGVFVGRDRDLATLLGQWQQIRSGGRGGVLLVGEAGIGKTRLLQAFRDIVNVRWITVRCNSSLSHTPLHPVLEAFSQPNRGALGQFIRARLATLGLDASGRNGLAIETSAARVEVLDELVRLVEDCAIQVNDGLRVLVMEDLHWADRSTLEFLGRLLQSTRLNRCLVLATSRLVPEVLARIDWVKVLELGPLDAAAAGILFHALSRDRDDVKAEEVIHQCGGNPLFLCEMAMAQGSELPGSLEGLVMAQLERLGEGKHLAQWASVLGETLKRTWLAAVAPEESINVLGLLLRRGLLIQHPSGDLGFRHALIRRAVLHSLPSRRAQESHHHVAQVIERAFPEEAQQMPERMALWLTEANDWHGALNWRLKAGRQAMRLMAMWEAYGHWQACIALVDKLPESPERDVLEREARSSMGSAVALVAAFGDASHENYNRLRELAKRAGDRPNEAVALLGMTFSEQQRGGQRAVLRLLRQVSHLRGIDHRPVTPDRWSESMVHSLGQAGRLRRAYQLAVDASQAELESCNLNHMQFHDPIVGIRARKLGYAWRLGHWKEALDDIDAVLIQARALGNPSTLMTAVALSGLTLVQARLVATARTTVEEISKLISGTGMDLYRVSINGFQGWCDIEQGSFSDGIQRIEQSLSDMEALKFRTWEGLYMIPLARAYAAIGNLDKAEHWIGQAKLELCRRGNFAYRPYLLLTEAAIMTARNPTRLDGPLKKVDKAWQLGAREGAHTTMLKARTERFRLSPDKASRKLLSDEVKFFDGQPELPDLVDARQLLKGK